MSEPWKEFDESVEPLLRETYERVTPSPAFRQELFQKLAAHVDARQVSGGWLGRVQAWFADPPALTRLRPQLTVGAMVAVALLLLVAGGVVVATRGYLGGISPFNSVPPTVRPITPTSTPTDSLLPASTEPTDEPVTVKPSPTLVAMPTEQTLSTATLEPPATATSAPTYTPLPPTATPEPTDTLAPTNTFTPPPTETSVPSATPSPVPTNTPVPTATPSPVLVSATATPVPTQVEPESTAPPPAPTECRGSSVTGIAWLDTNGNGERDEEDDTLGGVTVTLETDAHEVVGGATTGDDGRYAFNDLPAGIYTLRAVPPAGYKAITASGWGLDLMCAPITKNFGYQSEN